MIKSKNKNLIIFLLIFSGTLFGFSYPPFKTGLLSAVAFVPLFLVLSTVDTYGKAYRYSYLTFFVLNLISISWVGGFVHARDMYLMFAGIALLLAHPLFMSLPVIPFIFIKRAFNFKTALYSFPFVWISFEYLHSLTELAFPWLTLGNTQSYDISLIQFISYTGIYGVSFWLVVLNILFFIIFVKINLKEWKYNSFSSLLLTVIILIVYFIPKIYGSYILKSQDNIEKSEVKVSIIQPNSDPWEKWELSKMEIQLEQHQMMTYEICRNNDLVIWPETAIPFYVLLPQYEYYFNKIKQQIDSINIPLLSGIPDIYYYKPGEVNPPSAKRSLNSDTRYDSYNSSILITPKSNQIQKYAKIRLVPFSERVPYADAFNFLNFLKWDVGISGWGIGKDTTVFNMKLKNNTIVKFSNLICYESIYPDFVANFIRKGAQFLTIITNDSWWGNTFGPYQHNQFAVFRAIENRRWIARCANGGISCFIDPYGRIYKQTKMFTKTIIDHQISARTDFTFYTQQGNIFSKFCLFMSGFFLMAGLSQKFYKYVRRKSELH